MTLLEDVLNEYMTFVEIFKHKYGMEKDRIMIDREEFKTLLEKYGYLSFRDKTRIYKDLNLIIHDKKSYSISYKDRVLKKTVRKVAINYRTYETIKLFLSKESN